MSEDGVCCNISVVDIIIELFVVWLIFQIIKSHEIS